MGNVAGEQELRAGLIRAVDLAFAGDWHGAHALIDPICERSGASEIDKTACWVRACLHKIEREETNARLWYRRSGQFYESYAEPKAELAAIKAALTY